jgi:hypothetical protein
MSRSRVAENHAGFPEKSGFVVEFVRGQNQAECASFGAMDRRETKSRGASGFFRSKSGSFSGRERIADPLKSRTNA